MLLQKIHIGIRIQIDVTARHVLKRGKDPLTQRHLHLYIILGNIKLILKMYLKVLY